MSKHGGSPPSGLIVPAGLEHLQPVAPGSALVEPEIVARRRVNLERERQFERRRVALELLPTLAGITEHAVDDALALADELMLKTPVPPRDEVRDV
jgi:hypothetical protein